MPILRRIGLIYSMLSWMAGWCFARPIPSGVLLLVETADVPLNWQSPARLHRGLRTTRGALIINGGGVEFRSEQRLSHRWSLDEIQTLDLTPRRLILTGYENRGWHRPGDRRFRFDLEVAMPPGVAAELTRLVGKPVRNGIPDPQTPSVATLPARHRNRFGGSNGMLRFRDDGIDYVSRDGRDGRAWRWSDIETLANPDPYQLRVSGYRETYDFELKRPLPRELFERLWDKAYARGIHIQSSAGGHRP